MRRSPGRAQPRYTAGRMIGYQQGLIEGRHYGRALAVKQQFAAMHQPRLWNKRVLFVTSGKGFPYSPLDEAVAAALRKMTAYCETALPNDPILGIIDRVQPDLVLVLEGMVLPPDLMNTIHSRGIRTALWLTDDPYYTDITGRIAPYYEFVFTLEKSCLPFYQQMGCSRVHYLPLGANPDVFLPRPVHPFRRREISFIGTGYWNRIAFFNQVLPLLHHRNFLLSGWWWHRLRRFRTYRRKIQLGRWMGPQETSEVYCASQIVINLHRAFDDESYNSNSRKIPAVSLNPRTFEIAACGAFQLTDERSDLASFYVPGDEIITYSSPSDFVEKVNYYLSRPEERRDIALRALKRTLHEHTYEQRLNQLFTIIFEQTPG
ncbi:Uncharacterized protein conserved in bacteria [Chlamydia abortus]|nr:Uncharacterized protein conserved in bacteria [Chlamydia abortus]